MALKTFNPTTPSQRHLVIVDRGELWKGKPVKTLTEGLRQKGGRNNTGRTTVRWRGGGHKRRYRLVDFKRRKGDAPAPPERAENETKPPPLFTPVTHPGGGQTHIPAPPPARARGTAAPGGGGDG